MFQVECVGPAKTCATKVTQLCEEWHSSSYLSAEPTASTPQLRGVPYVVRPVRALGSKFPIFGTLVIGSDRLPFPRHPLIGRAFLRLVFRQLVPYHPSMSCLVPIPLPPHDSFSRSTPLVGTGFN